MLTSEIIQHSLLLVTSFEKATGKQLIPLSANSTETAETLYAAPFVLVSHGTEADPVFNYANLTAQQLWELDWKNFIKMPSRLSAEKISQAERQAMLEEARKNGYISNYQGVRISSTGRRFIIKNAILWNIYDEQDIYCGQAATFAQWEFL
ncbi:MEKHLA domain-containing protein [Rhodocytophaga aerolata]|uniref:MEKHLA domain-containing protein n=1 Tax=Rhodocytophaga aerolata TaxID=455078 RepID=A0ABT8R4L1_9BACT|nr:MEKHLA domain-containing protein [Rhodocytophaga aerolata]MDO1446884.1 MEKHLA domain-containing protein [Rhodocytophaga aerolata]